MSHHDFLISILKNIMYHISYIILFLFFIASLPTIFVDYSCPKPTRNTISHIIYAPTSRLHITLNHIQPPFFGLLLPLLLSKLISIQFSFFELPICFSSKYGQTCSQSTPCLCINKLKPYAIFSHYFTYLSMHSHLCYTHSLLYFLINRLRLRII